jgi:AraC family transcriptional regulator, transcriptional activator of pobA
MAKAQQDTIPFHKLAESTDRGYHLKRISSESDEVRGAMEMGAHRDDHYIFILQEKGLSAGMIDFHLFRLKENSVLYILPGQVHSYTKAEQRMEGWFLAIDADIIPSDLRSVLEDPLLMRKPFVATAAEMGMMGQCAGLAFTLDCREGSACSRQAVYSLLTSLIALVAGLYERRRAAGVVEATRPQAIAREFRLLLAKEYKALKSPADYAEALHLSAPYLNEAVKEATGCTVSYWIQQEIILEAKRLLFHSPCSVKEIAYQLGYEDHTYFSRLFKKASGRTPGDFRAQYRK